MNTTITIEQLKRYYGEYADAINWERPVDCGTHLKHTPGCSNCELIKPHNDKFADVEYCKHRVPVSKHCEDCEEDAYWAEMDRLNGDYKPEVCSICVVQLGCGSCDDCLRIVDEGN